MGKNRLEAFSDGVLAIIITIMVLEIKVPQNAEWSELAHLIPIFLGYVLSFSFVGIYWGNHHHLMHTVKRVSAGILWSNMNLLFWLSLVPFATGWMGETHFAQNTVIVYSVLLMICGFSYYILLKVIQGTHKADEHWAKVFAVQEKKGLISLVFYLAAIGFSFFNTAISGGIFLIVAIMWFIPDKNIEAALHLEN